MLEKHGVKKLAYKLADTVKPGVVRAVRYGLPAAVGSAAAAETLASLGLGGLGGASLTAATIPFAHELANYIDNPRAYQDQDMPSRANMRSAGLSRIGELGDNPYAALNSYTGERAGVLQSATEQLSKANAMNQQLSNAQGYARDALYSAPLITGGLNSSSIMQSTEIPSALAVNPITGAPAKVKPRIEKVQELDPLTGFVVGSGMRPSGMGMHDIIKRNMTSHYVRGKGMKERHNKMVEKGSIGIHGNILRTPQALVPQPFSQNFVWSSTLPPAYKRFSSTPSML